VAVGTRPGPDGRLLAGVALLLLPGVAGAGVADQPHPIDSSISYTPVCTEVTAQLGQPPDPRHGQHRRPVAAAAAGPGGSQPRSRSFADAVAFELGRDHKDIEDELAAGGGVSVASWRLRKPMPRSARLVTVSTRCRRERPRRSSLQTTRVSPGRSWSRGWPWAGRSLRAPLAVSVNARLVDALEGVDLELGLLVGGGRRWRSQAGVPCGERRRTLGRVGCATLISDTGSGHVDCPWPGDCGSCR
jgi:hypothetical protein